MRFAALILTVFLATGAFATVSAQESVSERSRLPYQTTADTDAAVPEWYQRFTFADRVETRPEWLGASNDRDVQVNVLKSNRWKLRLGLTSRDGETGFAREEMSAGATFNITPRFSIGGALSLGAEDLSPTSEWNAQELETGIRLQSAFKF